MIRLVIEVIRKTVLLVTASRKYIAVIHISTRLYLLEKPRYILQLQKIADQPVVVEKDSQTVVVKYSVFFQIIDFFGKTLVARHRFGRRNIDFAAELGLSFEFSQFLIRRSCHHAGAQRL